MKKIICFISFLLSFSACKDSELNINPSDSLDSRSAITTVDDLNAAVLGAYNRMTINTYYDGQYLTAGDMFMMKPDFSDYPKLHQPVNANHFYQQNH